MDNFPMVSVIMSIYNEPAKWLHESIKSILNQSYSKFEFIIINDNPDSEINLSILNLYKGKDERIRIVHNHTNLGLTKSLNIGISLGKGKYIARIDGDDISEPDRILNQLHILENYSDIFLVGAQGIVIDEFSNLVSFKRKPIHTQSIQWLFVTHGNPIIHSTAIFRRCDELGEITYYDEEFDKKQDFELWSRLARKGQVTNIDKIGVYYRVHSNQITKTYTRQDSCSINKLRINNLIYFFDCSKNTAQSYVDYMDLSSHKAGYLKKTLYNVLPALSKETLSRCASRHEAKEAYYYIISILIAFFNNAYPAKNKVYLLINYFWIIKFFNPFGFFHYFIMRIQGNYFSVTHKSCFRRINFLKRKINF